MQIQANARTIINTSEVWHSHVLKYLCPPEYLNIRNLGQYIIQLLITQFHQYQKIMLKYFAQL